MTEVGFSRQAERHLEVIRRSLTRDAGQRVALSWVRQLRNAALALSDFPDRGAFDPELGWRRLVVSPYLVFYRVGRGGRVIIVDVVDGRRDLRTALGDDTAL